MGKILLGLCSGLLQIGRTLVVGSALWLLIMLGATALAAVFTAFGFAVVGGSLMVGSLIGVPGWAALGGVSLAMMVILALVDIRSEGGEKDATA